MEQDSRLVGKLAAQSVLGSNVSLHGGSKPAPKVCGRGWVWTSSSSDTADGFSCAGETVALTASETDASARYIKVDTGTEAVVELLQRVLTRRERWTFMALPHR